MSQERNQKIMFKFVKKIETTKKKVITGDVLTILKSVKSVGTGYEVITGACIPYYDFDKEYDTESEQLANYKVDLDFAINALEIYYKNPNCKVFEFTACGFNNIKKKYKNSFHFRIRGFGYHNNTKEITKIDGFDTVPYNLNSQLFRLPYCSKEKQNRPLKRFNSATGEIVELDDILDKSKLNEAYESYLVQNIENENLIASPILDISKLNEIEKVIQASNEITEIIKKATDANQMFNDFTYKSHTTDEDGLPNIINFKRIRSSYCKTCDRTHDKDATPYISIHDNKMFWTCIRNKKAQFLCKVDDSIADIDKVKVVKLSNAIDFNEKYCTDIKELTDSIKNTTHSVIAVKSNMGTGKTYCIAECINEMGKNLQTAGVVSFRVSLANKYTTDFKGFTCYNTKKQKIIDDDKWVCQADSIHRIKPKEQPLEILVLDEVDQLRKHMTADTFMKNSNYLSNRAGLRQLIKTTKQVVIMSANITKADLDWIDSMRAVGTQLIINNRYISDPREINMVGKNKIIESIIDDFKHKKKFAIAHNGSVVKQEALKRQILRSGGHLSLDISKTEKYDILLINSATMSDANVKLALENPNVEFGKYAGIIYSPSVQSGLSYDVRDTIHSIYGIFGNASNSTNDACQMLHRIRNPINKQIMVWIDFYNFGAPKPTTVGAMMKHLKNARSHIYSNSKDIDTMAIIEKIEFDYNKYGELEFVESTILHEYCVNKAEHNLDSILYKKNFIKSQLEYGNTVIYDADKGQKKTAIDNKTINKEVELEDAIKLHEAVLIDDVAKIELKKRIDNDKESVTQEEYTQLRKKNIIDSYEVSGDSPQWYLTYGNSATKKHYKSLSEYYMKNQSLALSLADLKKKEIVNDVYNRVGSSETESKNTDQCIIDSILNKPKYMKHRVLIDWLLLLGFTTLDDKLEIKADDLKAHLAVILNNMTDSMMDCLEKSIKNLEAIKKLKITDERFVGNLLKFINGSLKSEFGISIKKKSKHSSEYILLNEYVKNAIFFNPFVENLEDQFIPILGKHKYVCPIRMTGDNDEPYDSDDDIDTSL
jgi:Ni2+-binding GTPase involved in maturation of urease and hydrogenase